MSEEPSDELFEMSEGEMRKLQKEYQDEIDALRTQLDAYKAALEKLTKNARKSLNCLYEFCEKNCSGADACSEYIDCLGDAISNAEEALQTKGVE